MNIVIGIIRIMFFAYGMNLCETHELHALIQARCKFYVFVRLICNKHTANQIMQLQVHFMNKKHEPNHAHHKVHKMRLRKLTARASPAREPALARGLSLLLNKTHF